MTNTLFYGDNLDVLRSGRIAPASVDLCYIDPPFNSKRNYFQIYNNIGAEDRAQAQAFVDTWEWGEEADHGFAWLTHIDRLTADGDRHARLTEQTAALIKGLLPVLGKGSLMAYLVSLTQRIVEIHRVLKPTGSFYLHCDPTASHYLKLVCDAVFCGQGGDFRNEVIWSYDSGGRPKMDFARKHDVIFRYSKSKNYTFNPSDVSVPRGEIRHNHMKKHVDEDGRAYRTIKSAGKIYRYYDDEGVIPSDVWQISHLQQKDPERLGYPTQKPEALLERIIKASSNEGDVVLDAYCGCGTTVAVAQRLNRRWVGIDITYQSISLILKRLEDRYKDEWPAIEAGIRLDGVPRDMASAIALANRRDDKTRKEFEKWAVLAYSANRAVINEKKGGDGGIDGIAWFLKAKDANGKLLFSVKSDKAITPAYVDQLAGTMAREGAELGVLLCLHPPSKGCYERARHYGKYTHDLFARSDDKIRIVTVEDMLPGENRPGARLQDWLPMAHDVVKAATPKGDADQQMGLI